MENLDKYNELSLKKSLEQQDYELFITRCKKRFESSGFKEKTIIYKKQKISIKRRCYYDHKEKKYVFLLDEFLHINKNQHISEDDKECAYELIALQNELSAESNRRCEGKIYEVLIEGVSKRSKDQLYGRTEQNKVVIFDRGTYRIGLFVKVKVTESSSATLKGFVVED